MENEERSPFGRRLFESRDEAGFTQAEAAKAVGMRSQSTLAEAETSGKRSGYTTQLAELYKVSATWLATGKGPKHLLTGSLAARESGSDGVLANGNVFAAEPQSIPYTHPNPTVRQVIAIMEATDESGKGMVLMAAQQALEKYYPTKESAA